MNKRLIFESKEGYCHIVVADPRFQQPTETEAIALARLYANAIPEICEFIACEEKFIPKDLTFRDAWKKGDYNEPIKIDFKKALEIHRNRIQKAASRKIEVLQTELQEAVKKSNLPLQVAIKSTCKILETIHLMNMTHCKTLDDIKYCIPKELHEVWSFYPPVRNS